MIETIPHRSDAAAFAAGVEHLAEMLGVPDLPPATTVEMLVDPEGPPVDLEGLILSLVADRAAGAGHCRGNLRRHAEPEHHP